MSDTLYGTILADGTVQITSGKVSAPNHTSAEEYLSRVSHLTSGGKFARVANPDRIESHQFGFDHQHEHGHEH
jgi:hypothetical protein